MDIHEDQDKESVRALCELADFVDSGYQSFREQVTHLPAQKMAEAAFYAGAALAMKLAEYFKDRAYSELETQFLRGLLAEEVNRFMDKNGMKLEWEPHVPSAWKQ